MIRSRIFIPAKFNSLIERANEICKEREFYQIAKTEVVRIICRHQSAFKCDVYEAARAAVVANQVAARYVGLDVVAKVNEGVIISAVIPRDLNNYARSINQSIGARRSVRMWQVAIKLFSQILDANSEEEIVNAFVSIYERETMLAAKIS